MLVFCSNQLKIQLTMIFQRLRLCSIFITAFLLFFSTSQAQVQTPRYNVSMTSISNGYYEYLPAGYSTPGNQANYSVIIFLHGQGERGDGTSAQLPKVLANGPPKLINQGTFPASFTVNGQTFSFIVISPQFISTPTPSGINDIINYVIQNYRVDINRIYLTGLSMGGGGVWNYAGYNSTYANRLAAIIPVCGASSPSTYRANIIAATNLPVWATHNNGDPTVPVTYTNTYIDYLNAAPVPSIIPPKKSIFNANGHDAWSTTYNPSWKENGIYNAYEWLLMNQRGIAVLPVILSSYKASITAADKVLIEWTTTQEQNNSHFTIERSTDGITFINIGQVPASNSLTGSSYSYIDNLPTLGVNYYRLSQTDIDGKIIYFDIKKVTIEDQNAKAFIFYPNPVISNANLELNFPYTGKLSLSIYQTDGKMVKQFQFNKISDYIRQQLNLEDLVPGYYNLEMKGINFLNSILFIKH